MKSSKHRKPVWQVVLSGAIWLLWYQPARARTALGYKKTLGVGWRDAFIMADTFLTRILARKLQAKQPTPTHKED